MCPRGILIIFRMNEVRIQKKWGFIRNEILSNAKKDLYVKYLPGNLMVIDEKIP